MNTGTDVPRIAKTDEEISRCFPVMSELRPHLQADSFLALVRGMELQGFRLAFIEDNKQVVAAAGFRIFTSLFMGKNLYVDDLVTTGQSRSAGYGKIMLDWLRDVAKEADAGPDLYEPRFAPRGAVDSRRARANFSTSLASRVFSTLPFSSHPFRPI